MDGQDGVGSRGEAAVKGAIETREVISVSVGGVNLRGTFHKPQSEASDSSLEQDKGNRIGVLFLTWFVPRAGNGDSGVYWAESMAKCGYLAFRLDLPGHGDADGELAMPGIDIDGGAYGPALSGIASQLVERYHLKAVVVVATCTGAVTTIYAAADNECIKGLVLMDPYFHVQPVSQPRGLLVRWQMSIVRALAWDRVARPGVRDGGVKLLSLIRGIYHRVTSIGNRTFARRTRLPGNANLPLIRCWNQLANRHIPMLVMRSPSSAPALGDFDYLDFLRPRSDADCRISIKQIERAGAIQCTRAFAERHGKETVRTNTEQWLSAYFPLITCAATRDRASRSREHADAAVGVIANAH
jgi:pimeloyl-ACP methyl ester carboxylesterase